jgi:hypothetical protein
MLGYLTILSASAIIFTVALMVYLFKNKNFREIVKCCAIGTLVAAVDFIFEYFGTLNSHWTYNESIYFIFDLVPIELVFLFFSAGVIARFIFLNIEKLRFPIRTNAIFYTLILSAAILYIRDLYMEPFPDMMPLAILIGLWGISNISERNRESSLVLAILAAIVDFIAEIIVIGSGSYSYSNGFSFYVPLIYGLYTLGLLAIMEKLNRLDRFLDHPVVRNILKVLGIYRKKYKKKLKNVEKKITKRINGKIRKIKLLFF